MATTFPGLTRQLLLAGAVCAGFAAVGGCANVPDTNAVNIPAIPAGEARVWIYRDYSPSETLNMTAVAMNGTLVGYSQPGGAFYRDVPPGQYHVAANSYGTDINQSTNLDLRPGQEAYVKIESLRSWSSDGEKTAIGRDTFYARPIPTELARAEVAHSKFNGGT